MEQNQNNWNDWNNHNMNFQDSTNSPYHNQPTHSPYRDQAFGMASGIFGLLAMLSTCFVVLPFIFGAFSILFASLHYRKGKLRRRYPVGSVAMACVGIFSSLFMIVQTFIKLPEQMQNPQYREFMNQTFEQLYGDMTGGMNFEDFMEEYYGVTFDE